LLCGFLLQCGDLYGSEDVYEAMPTLIGSEAALKDLTSPMVRRSIAARDKIGHSRKRMLTSQEEAAGWLYIPYSYKCGEAIVSLRPTE
jgi:hypothetical protein